MSSPEERTRAVRCFVLEMHRRNQDRLRGEFIARANNPDDITQSFMYFGNYPHYMEELDAFIERVILRDQDDEEVASALYHGPPQEVRGPLAYFILRHRAAGPRVRALFLKECWVDGNSYGLFRLMRVGLTTLVDFFRSTPRELLMSEDECRRLAHNDGEMLIYRGAELRDQSVRRAASGLSWATDLETARFFARSDRRVGDMHAVLQARIPVEHVLALWTASGREPEVVVDWRRLRGVKIWELWPRREAA